MLFKFFIIIISLSPLFFGSNRVWSWSLYSSLIACLGAVYFYTVLTADKKQALSLTFIKIPLLLISITLLWIYLQTVTWLPASWLHPFWQLTANHLNTEVAASISISPANTIEALMRLISYCLVFFLSFQFSRQSKNASFIFNSVAYVGTLYALYGLIAFWGDYKSLFGFEKLHYLGNVSSTFVNRNSYATYAGLGILASFPLLISRLQRSLKYGIQNNYGLQYFIENVIVRAGLPLLMIFIISTALLLSHSRGGFLSSLFAIIVFLILPIIAKKVKVGKISIMLLMIVTFTTAALWSSGDKLLERMDQITLTADKNGRLAVYELLEQQIAENPWLGMGYGSFEKSFRLYRNETVKGYYTMAHNTYLENMFELGVLPAGCLFLALFYIGLQCLRGVWQRQQHWYYPAIGCCATLLVGAHALVDFSLQIPAVAYTYTLLMGAALAQSLPRSQRLSS